MIHNVNIPDMMYLHSMRSFMRQRRSAFTLVEMLVAMTVTLLMMAALARAFAFLGEKFRDSRANLALSNELRDLTTRLKDDLSRCTVKLTPNLGGPDQPGYFLYSEGPVTDATSSLFRSVIDAEGNIDLPDSRYGDFDDYIAFTAVAPPNSWFTGKVPRYILDQKRAQLTGGSYALPSTAIEAFEPVMIRSKYAEIIYFASPEYGGGLSTSGITNAPNDPQYVDVDGDSTLAGGAGGQNGLPDRIKIHRRVLLIRPDLNLDDGMLPVQQLPYGSGSDVVHFMQPDAWPTGTNATLNPGATAADAWLFGMAAVHQQCDLSVRRVLNSTGGLTARCAANSLTDLAQPHNRFAHVRVPANVITGSGTAAYPTSMPVIAFGGAATILESTTLGGSPARLAPPRAYSAGTVVTPTLMSGFLRPEFVLGQDVVHKDSPIDAWGLERIGEDVLVNNALSFDVKIYDPEVTSFTTTYSLVVGPNDAGYREALLEAVANPAQSTSRGELKGGYVDLAYPVLAGGSLRGWQARRLDRLQGTDSSAVGTAGSYLVTPFSGVESYVSAANNRNAYAKSLYKSGRLLVNNGNITLFQPAFDTYTSHYETDGLYQQSLSGTSKGTVWPLLTNSNAADVDLGRNGIDGGERETLPPFTAPAESIQISVRLINPATRLIRQMSVIHSDTQ
ncbi:MAG: type II secretion system protein J [Novipirellula sp. JB048]